MDSLIIRIAAGVCLGILAAGVIWKHWKSIAAWTGCLLFMVLLIGGPVWLVWANWERLRGILATAAMGFCMAALMYGVPFLAYGGLMRSVARLGPLVRGEPPWNQVKRLPLRLTAMAVIAMSVAALGIAALFLALWVAEKLGLFD